MIPTVIQHEGIIVIRDDLFPGGTKARFIEQLYEGVEEVVYATPAQGGAQTALAHTAARLGKRATLFVAKRAQPHARTLEAKRVGARVFQVAHGYLSVVQARAQSYCKDTGATMAPFGMAVPGAADAIAKAAMYSGIEPDEVWCAAGSGVLTRALQQAWPKAVHFAVQVGRELGPEDVWNARIMVHPLAFDKQCKAPCPFPSDPHYDRKAWEICRKYKGGDRRRTVVFWNVTGPAQP